MQLNAEELLTNISDSVEVYCLIVGAEKGFLEELICESNHLVNAMVFVWVLKRLFKLNHTISFQG